MTYSIIGLNYRGEDVDRLARWLRVEWPRHISNLAGALREIDPSIALEPLDGLADRTDSGFAIIDGTPEHSAGAYRVRAMMRRGGQVVELDAEVRPSSPSMIGICYVRGSYLASFRGDGERLRTDIAAAIERHGQTWSQDLEDALRSP